MEHETIITTEKIINILRGQKERLHDEFNVKEIGIFGSFVRGEQEESSDLDVLVEFEPPVGFFKFLELEEYLDEAIGVKVDLVSRKALKPIIGQYILAELIRI
jgi:uncharacterized protein